MKSTSNDPRSQRTRQLLREALIESVIEKSFRDITVRDITDHAGVNRATFYLHYEDKYDLLEDCTTKIFVEVRTLIQSELAIDPEKPRIGNDQAFRRMQIVLNYIQANAGFFRAMMRDDGDTIFHNQFRETTARFIKFQVQKVFDYHQKDVHEDIVDMMVRFQSAGNFEVIGWWLDNDMHIPIDVMAARLATVTMPSFFRLLLDEDSNHINN